MIFLQHDDKIYLSPIVPLFRQEWGKKIVSDRFRVLTLVKNLGKGGAVRRGVLVARGRRILFADADGATTFSELEKLMKALPGTIYFKARNGDENIILQMTFFLKDTVSNNIIIFMNINGTKRQGFIALGQRLDSM
jgi:glycosyltransferase involved in cell wall biosynthesis